jgi:acetyltransferase-like isoleucine patch superfamily enzyme
MTHDNHVGNFNFVSTDVTFGGNSIVYNNCFIGLNSTIKSSIEIHDYSLIGSASNVLESTIKKGVYVGNPARKLENKSSLETKI